MQGTGWGGGSGNRATLLDYICSIVPYSTICLRTMLCICLGVRMHAHDCYPPSLSSIRKQMVSGLPNWVRLWTILRQNQLRCWTFPEDVGSKMPVFNMTLTEVGKCSARRMETL